MSAGIRFEKTPLNGIECVKVLDLSMRSRLAWDRVERLEATVEFIENVAGQLSGRRSPLKILDLNGVDGALGAFLPGAPDNLEERWKLDVFYDDTTPGGNFRLPAGDRSYDVVVSVGDLEHVPPPHRHRFLSELARVADKAALIGFPALHSLDAQKLAYKLTGDKDIGEHVKYGLVDDLWVSAFMTEAGFSCTVSGCSSTAVWLPYFILSKRNAQEADTVGDYLREHMAQAQEVKNGNEQCLYRLVECLKRTDA